MKTSFDKYRKPSDFGQVYFIKITHYRGKSRKLYDEFYKIGFTSKFDLQDRMDWLPDMFEVEILDSKQFKRSEALHIERWLHRGLKSFSYKPKHKFSGSHEAYKLNLTDHFESLDEMIKYVTIPEVGSPKTL